MCKDFEEKVNCPPLLSSHPSLFTSSHANARRRRRRRQQQSTFALTRKTPKTKSHTHTYSHAQKPSPLWCCWRGRDVRIKIRPRVSSFFCVGLSLVHTFRSPFDVDAFFFFFSAYKQHYQQQNGPIRERLRIGTRPKLRQRRDWETDIESARAAGRDADVYFRER